MPDRVTRILAIRHGETAWNVDTRIQGQLDIPLNETGRWQAHRLALAMAGEAIDALYSSDLLRAFQNAQALAAGSGLPIATDPGLRERGFGVFEGHTYADIDKRWPAQALSWRRREPRFSPPGGETLEALFERSVATVTRLAARHPGKTVAVVAHGGVLDCLYRAAARVGLQATRTWQLGNASINRLLYADEGFTLVGWSDTFHLEDPSLNESSDSEGGAERVGHAT